MKHIQGEIFIGAYFVIVMLFWTIKKYFTNTKGQYKRSFKGFISELNNSLFHQGTKRLPYPEEDKISLENQNKEKFKDIL